MTYELQQFVSGEWWKYGRYNTESLSGTNAMIEAAHMLGRHGIKVRVVEVSK